MKKYINIKELLFSLLIIIGVSCESYLEETNENPNDPTQVSPAALLSPAQLTLAFEYGSNFSRFSSIFVQHIEGQERQQFGFNNYVITGSVFDTDWRLTYVDILNNVNIMIAQSSENGYDHYIGVGKTLKAYTLMLMTDYWNSIPYSEGLSGIEVLQPKFDSQADIYTEVHALLNQARQSLAAGDGGLSLSGDLIYSGDISLWIKATHAIEARAYLHQGLLSPSNYTSALASIESAFDSEAENMTFQFGTGATTAAPWYQFNRDRGDIGFNSTMNDAMVSLSDPRLDIYDGDGTDTFASEVDEHELFTINQELELITYTELMFAKAECLLATGGAQTDIREAYLAGIKSSFSTLGLDTDYAAYIAQTSVSPVGDLTLENVMTQKWLALYTNPEAYSDWRRTGIPSLTPNNGVAIPTRWLYPQSESELNSNTPTVVATDKVDWDVN